MDEIIVRLNIEHFRKKLAEEVEEPTRRTLLQLLAEEEAKLAALGTAVPAERRKQG
jgi:hypothetical protein